jgi:hypothetical protein
MNEEYRNYELRRLTKIAKESIIILKDLCNKESLEIASLSDNFDRYYKDLNNLRNININLIDIPNKKNDFNLTEELTNEFYKVLNEISCAKFLKIHFIKLPDIIPYTSVTIVDDNYSVRCGSGYVMAEKSRHGYVCILSIAYIRDKK